MFGSDEMSLLYEYRCLTVGLVQMRLRQSLAQPWDGLRQVSRKSKTIIDDSRLGDSNKACSIDTCRDSTIRDSSYEGECRNRFSWLVKDMPLTYA